MYIYIRIFDFTILLVFKINLGVYTKIYFVGSHLGGILSGIQFKFNLLDYVLMLTKLNWLFENGSNITLTYNVLF